MLQVSKTFSSFSVSDIENAMQFYSEILGLDIKKGEMGILELHLAGGSHVIIYPKEDHIPATFTVLNFQVADIKEAIQHLRSKGISFEQYDEPGFKTDEDGILRGEGSLIAWFKDPFGNILSVIQQ